MSSPPRLRRSPAREALHERSDSQTNERGSPQLRYDRKLEDLDHPGDAYTLKPAQVLLPVGQYGLPSHQVKNSALGGRNAQFEGIFGQEDEPKKADRSPKRTSFNHEKALHLTGGKSEASTNKIPQSTATSGLHHISDEGSIAPVDKIRESQNPSALHSGSVSSGVSAEPLDETPTIVTGTTERQPSNKDSDNSLSSTNTTGTVVVRKARDGKARSSYSAFPPVARPSSSRSAASSSPSSTSSPKVPSTRAPQSPAVSESSATSTKDRSGSPAEQVRDAAGNKDPSTNLQYPVVNPPSRIPSWAESSDPVPPIPTKAPERREQRWNPHLSTVQSEGTPSISDERSSQGLSIQKTRNSRASPKAFEDPTNSLQLSRSSCYSLEHNNLDQKAQRIGAPQDLEDVHAAVQSDPADSTIRIVGRQGSDPQAEGLQSDPERFEPNAMRLRDQKRNVPTDRNSQASFFHDSIPPWAKTYYARPSSATSSPRQRDSVATDNISLNVWRPHRRSRPPAPGRRRSGLAMHPTRPQNLVLADTRGVSKRFSPTLSPHLWRDRTSVYQRRSVYKVPSIDEAAEGNALTKRNAQIMCFSIGFIFPLSWFLGAILPLPQKPDALSDKGKRVDRMSAITQDLEKRLGPTDLARYENARWWRNINRIMCLAGVAILVLLIALVVVSTS